MAADLVPMVMCASNEHCEVQVPSSDGKKTYTLTFGRVHGKRYSHGWTCNCKSFQFRGQCKHEEEAEKQRCSWHQQWDGGKAKNGKCPECGGEVVAVMVAI